MSNFKPRATHGQGRSATYREERKALLAQVSALRVKVGELQEEVRALRHELKNAPLTDEGWNGLSAAEQQALEIEEGLSVALNEEEQT